MKALFAFVALFASSNLTWAAAPGVGANAPCISLAHTAMDGTTSTRSTCAASTANKKIVLDFFETSCIYCVRYMPTFENLVNKYSDKAEFRVMGLNEKQDELLNFFKSRAGWKNYEVAWDPKAESFDAFGFDGIPTTVVIGVDGRIEYIHVGTIETAAELQALEDAITK